MNTLYTASEAREKLGGVSPETLKRYVDSGKIRKVTPPTNKKRGYYDRGDVDNLAEAMQDFIEMHTLIPKSEASNFEVVQANGENDIKETVQIARQHLGDNAYGLEKRMSWYNKAPNGDYVLKYNGIVVGYFSMQAIKPEAVERIFNLKNGASVQLEDMTPIESGKPLNLHISGMGVRTGVSRKDAKKYGLDLISGVLDQFIKLGTQGIEISKIWAKSSTVPGIKLSRDLGFTELGYINNEQIGFALDMNPKKATKPLVKKYLETYQQALKDANTKKKHFPVKGGKERPANNAVSHQEHDAKEVKNASR